MEVTRWDFPVNSVRICLEQRQPEPVGFIWAAACAEPVHFSGTRELVARVNRLFDRIGQPQSGQVMRSFCDEEQSFTAFDAHPARCHSAQELEQKRGKCGEIDLLLRSRRHAEWQGLVRLAGGDAALDFNSTVAFLEWLESL